MELRTAKYLKGFLGQSFFFLQVNKLGLIPVVTEQERLVSAQDIFSTAVSFGGFRIKQT